MEIPLLSEAAFVLSKARSVQIAKRPRDAFDIYYVLCGPQKDTIAARLRELVADQPAAERQIRSLREWLGNNSSVFNRNVAHFARRPVTDASVAVLELLEM